ncbi:hypothetical protein DIS09_06720 [Burkholderia pseudomallei]|nr:hypothetical protein [Burkholderia pseudomallei]MBM5587624.1 hypothetical protein [Burkholderia pseudomallei]MBM5615815.1 hypothetical protein [Burkholderia pseudomallei]MBM5632465.1 hypothetical protein [Burkholderia pseudomallei]MBM5644418.1 hypothetical protein [Burkholderia pseudomallei]
MRQVPVRGAVRGRCGDLCRCLSLGLPGMRRPFVCRFGDRGSVVADWHADQKMESDELGQIDASGKRCQVGHPRILVRRN